MDIVLPFADPGNLFEYLNFPITTTLLSITNSN